MLLWYRKWIPIEIRNKIQCDTQTQKRMKKPWAFLIFNTQSTFCIDTPKANCKNKKIKKNWNGAVSVSLLPVQWIVKQKCLLNVEVIPWWSRSLWLIKEQVGFQTAAQPTGCACWLPGTWHFLCVKGWKESSGGFYPDSARHQELTGGNSSTARVTREINWLEPLQRITDWLLQRWRSLSHWLRHDRRLSEGLRPFLSHKVHVNIQEPFCDSPLCLSKCPCLAECF